MRDALLRFSFAAQADERLPLKIQNVLLRNRLRRGNRTPGQNVGKFACHNCIIFAGKFSLSQQIDRELGRREKFLA